MKPNPPTPGDGLVERLLVAQRFLSVWYDWPDNPLEWWNSLSDDERNRGLRAADASLALRTRDEAARSATSEVQAILRNVVSHATGGNLDIADQPGIGLNAICVQISQHHNRIWKGGVENGRALQAKDHSNAG